MPIGINERQPKSPHQRIKQASGNTDLRRLSQSAPFLEFFTYFSLYSTINTSSKRLNDLSTVTGTYTSTYLACLMSFFRHHFGNKSSISFIRLATNVLSAPIADRYAAVGIGQGATGGCYFSLFFSYFSFSRGRRSGDSKSTHRGNFARVWGRVLTLGGGLLHCIRRVLYLIRMTPPLGELS